MAQRDRPWIHLNCAVGLDGSLAGPGGEPVRFSGDADMRRVHALRADMDAILVGVGTILQDDPSLRVKAEYATGPDPIRVVLDRQCRTPPDARVRGPQTLILDDADVEAAMQQLASRGVKSVLVEGGAQILASFLRSDWDIWTVYVAPMIVGGEPRLPQVPEAILRTGKVEPLGEGVLWTFTPAVEAGR